MYHENGKELIITRCFAWTIITVLKLVRVPITTFELLMRDHYDTKLINSVENKSKLCDVQIIKTLDTHGSYQRPVF